MNRPEEAFVGAVAEGKEIDYGIFMYILRRQKYQRTRRLTS